MPRGVRGRRSRRAGTWSRPTCQHAPATWSGGSGRLQTGNFQFGATSSNPGRSSVAHRASRSAFFFENGVTVRIEAVSSPPTLEGEMRSSRRRELSHPPRLQLRTDSVDDSCRGRQGSRSADGGGAGRNSLSGRSARGVRRCVECGPHSAVLRFGFRGQSRGWVPVKSPETRLRVSARLWLLWPHGRVLRRFARLPRRGRSLTSSARMWTDRFRP